MMYNEQLEKLIDLALADGVLTEKEKQILFKKAENLGVDLDEFEMVLYAKLHEKQKLSDKTVSKPKTNKLGDIKKCPACGAIAETFATKCADCGVEFRNLEASKNVVNFFEKLDTIELTRKDDVSNVELEKNNISFGRVLLWLFFWYIILPYKIINYFISRTKPVKWLAIDNRKEELVLNYPIPNSREEILEFLTLASSKIYSNTYFNVFSEETKYKNKWNKIWMRKIEQIKSKSILSMKNDKQTLTEVEIICSKSEKMIKDNNKKVLHIVLGFLILMLIMIGYFVISNIVDKQVLQQEKILKIEAESYIKSKEYNKAVKVINSINTETIKVDLQSQIQLEKLVVKIDELELLLKKKEYTKIKLELEKATWFKISKEYKTEKIEREYFKMFLKRKEALNHQLPKKLQIKVESEYSL